MVKRGRDLDEEIADLGRREVEAQQRRDKALVLRAMGHYVELAPKLRRHAESIGYDLLGAESKTVEATVAPSASRQLTAQQKRLESLKERTHAAAAREAALPDNADWIPSKYQKLEDFSTTMLRDNILCHIEEHALSKPNLRAMKNKGGPSATKQSLLRILEYVTGCPPDFELSGAMRYWPWFLTCMCFRSKQRGRRGSSLPLPPDWDNSGLLSLSLRKGTIVAMHNIAKVEVRVPADLAPPFGAFADLRVMYNWSEARALVCSRKQPAGAGVLIAQLFETCVIDATLKLPSPPRQALLRLQAGKQRALADRRVHEVLPLENVIVEGSPEKDDTTAGHAPDTEVLPAARDAADGSDIDEEAQDHACVSELDVSEEEAHSPAAGVSYAGGGAVQAADDLHDIPPPPS